MRKKGHVTTRSKKCLHHNEYIAMKKNQMISLPQIETQRNNNISLTTGNTIENQKSNFENELLCTFIENENDETCENKNLTDFGTSTFDATTQVVSLAHSSTAQFSTLEKHMMVTEPTRDISSVRETLPEATPVHDTVQNFETAKSTGVDSTEHSNKRNFDSISDNIIGTQDNVEDFFDMDEFSDVYSVSSSENSIDTQIVNSIIVSIK